jgi:hypothetical protein
MAGEAPTLLESKALDVALSVDRDWARALRKQIPALKVTNREHTGVGLWVEFVLKGEHEPARIRIDDPDYPPTVIVRHQALPELGSFIVFTRNGLITALEGVAHGDGTWPHESRVEDFELVPAWAAGTPSAD